MTERVETTNTDYEIVKAFRSGDVGKLLSIYSAAGECTTQEWGVIQHFVNWIHHLKVQGYVRGPAPGGGSPPQSAKFERLTKLGKNWDSYDGEPISPAAIQRAEDWLASVQVVPCSDGGVQLEWHSGGCDVETVFRADGSHEVWAENAEDKTPVGVARPGEDAPPDKALAVQALVYLDEFVSYQPGTTMAPQREKAEACLRVIADAVRGTPPSRTEPNERPIMDTCSECGGRGKVRA